MLVSFYVNGKLSYFGKGDWNNNIPQIGAEFHVYLDNDKKMDNFAGKEHILIVDRVLYDPYIDKEDNEIPYSTCDVNVYLIDKPKPIEIK